MIPLRIGRALYPQRKSPRLRRGPSGRTLWIGLLLVGGGDGGQHADVGAVAREVVVAVGLDLAAADVDAVGGVLQDRRAAQANDRGVDGAGADAVVDDRRVVDVDHGRNDRARGVEAGLDVVGDDRVEDRDLATFTGENARGVPGEAGVGDHHLDDRLAARRA